MTDKRFQIIYDFCDWLGCQGLAYEILYYGGDEDIECLINNYLEDEEWSNREDGDEFD